MKKSTKLPVMTSVSALSAGVRLSPLIRNHMVLQRSSATAVWGTASPGERILVQLENACAETIAASDGSWIVHLNLQSVPGNGPFSMTVQGKNTIQVRDILLGEVWIAAGQSNMAKIIGPSPNQFPCINWEDAVRQSIGKPIRVFHVPYKNATSPVRDLRTGSWKKPSKVNTPKFTAAGYFFAERLNRELNVPVGILENSIGGTSVFQWTGRDTLLAAPGTAEKLRKQDADLAAQQKFIRWCRSVHALYQPNKLQNPRTVLSSGKWLPIELKGTIRPPRGVHWFRTTVSIPPEMQNSAFALRGLTVRNMYRKVLCNGHDIEFVDGRHHTAISEQPVCRPFIPGRTDDGRYTIALRLAGPTADGAILAPDTIRLCSGKYEIPLQWETRTELLYPPLPDGTAPYPTFDPPTAWTFLRNGMLSPLRNMTVAGVIWYQGEQDSAIPEAYQHHFSRMIADWRNELRRPDLPFLFCQLPGFGPVPEDPNSNPPWARLRNSQFLTSKAVPGTAMAVLIDLGESADVHPRRKQEVGERLAGIALAKCYGRPLLFSGPLYREAKVENGKIRLFFDHAEGLRAADVPKRYEVQEGKAPGHVRRKSPASPLEGFAIRGADGVWQWAHAEIDGDTVLVSHPAIPNPAAVRYDWGCTVFGNLTNSSALPAAPFTTETPPAEK